MIYHLLVLLQIYPNTRRVVWSAPVAAFASGLERQSVRRVWQRTRVCFAFLIWIVWWTCAAQWRLDAYRNKPYLYFFDLLVCTTKFQQSLMTGCQTPQVRVSRTSAFEASQSRLEVQVLVSRVARRCASRAVRIRTRRGFGWWLRRSSTSTASSSPSTRQSSCPPRSFSRRVHRWSASTASTRTTRSRIRQSATSSTWSSSARPIFYRWSPVCFLCSVAFFSLTIIVSLLAFGVRLGLRKPRLERTHSSSANNTLF